MAESRDRDLVDELIRELELTGLVGDVLGFSPIILPTVSVGAIRPAELEILQPAFATGEIQSFSITPPIASTLYLTQVLEAGTYDLVLDATVSGAGSCLFGVHDGAGAWRWNHDARLGANQSSGFRLACGLEIGVSGDEFRVYCGTVAAAAMSGLLMMTKRSSS